MQKINVLHIIKSLGRGGAEMLLQETLRLHHQDQFEFHYIYFLPWKDQMVKGIEEAGGTVTLMPARNNIQIMRRASDVANYVRTHHIQLIHCHLPWAGFLGRWLYKRCQIPLVYTEHNIQDRYHVITRVLNKLSFNYQTKVVAVSTDVALSIQQRIRPAIPVQTILNGVNTDRFVRRADQGAHLREQYAIQSNEVWIGTIAVFRFQKRLKEWITLFKSVHQQCPHVKGVIIGDGPLKPEIMEHLRAEGMEEYIYFPGLQTDVMPWLSAIDIFMMTSSFEGLPIALLEAMSMECAVISTNAGGIKEVIRDGSDGHVKPVDEWQQLKDPLVNLIQDSVYRKKMGQQARKRVMDEFSMRSMVDTTEQMYRSLLNS